MFAALSAALLIIRCISFRCITLLNDQSLLCEYLNGMSSYVTFGIGRYKHQADITLLFVYTCEGRQITLFFLKLNNAYIGV